MADKSLGLYIHIPFCLQKCLYCDFCSYPAVAEEMRSAYVAALCREIREAAPILTDYLVDTMFFGGGTPSLLSAEEYLHISKAVFENYRVVPSLEFTSEANPATLDDEKLTAMREAGINRLSIGMQSANAGELSALGRVHRNEDVFTSVEMARRAGFDNINLDLMFGIPEQTKETFATSLEAALSMSPEHLSVYSLQIEEGTPFYERRTFLSLPSEEEESEMAELLYRTAERSGYRRYEISNFARDGMECRHNLRYWRMQDYRGFGVSAHSLIGDHRFFNGGGLSTYIHDPLGIAEEEELLSPAMREYEALMLALRTADGVEDAAFTAEFGHGFAEKYGKRIAPFLSRGLMVLQNGRYALTKAGMSVSNGILREILDEM
ncbi:MAG: radical SAM family heme chaperone HemW [Clostridia bacterium]|nr:radical SAM family heme chaperone HemW [Clostridia bacterium]